MNTQNWTVRFDDGKGAQAMDIIVNARTDQAAIYAAAALIMASDSMNPSEMYYRSVRLN